jgi:hypothetical protein
MSSSGLVRPSGGLGARRPRDVEAAEARGLELDAPGALHERSCQTVVAERVVAKANLT